jgi:hypothetical protein
LNFWFENKPSGNPGFGYFDDFGAKMLAAMFLKTFVMVIPYSLF